MGTQAQLLFDEASNSPESLEKISSELLERAHSLSEYKSRDLIFGQGPVGARLAIVGESPGPPDISTGQPFMGPAGAVLEKMIQAIGLKRSDCYLTNVIKIVCTGDEITPSYIAFFGPYLLRELLATKPQLILAMGNTPTKVLLNTKKPISQVRGNFHDFRGIGRHGKI
jgi:uracil-DNA glycosylase